MQIHLKTKEDIEIFVDTLLHRDKKTRREQRNNCDIHSTKLNLKALLHSKLGLASFLDYS